MGRLTEIPYNEVCQTLEVLDRLGVSREDLTRFREATMEEKTAVVKLIKGTTVEVGVVDLDADPFVPENWTVEEHRRGGKFLFEPSKMGLYTDEHQKGGFIQGYELRRRLASQPVLNVNVLDFLLANPRFILEEWGGDGSRGRGRHSRQIFFWGTVYKSGAGVSCVRYLHKRGGKWKWGNQWLEDRWDNRSPAAVRV